MTRALRPRREGVRATLGLIVEGETEYLALPLLYREKLVPGCPPLRAVNLGGVGSTLTAAAIARLLAPKVIAHQAAGRSTVVACIDRESRSACVVELGNAIKAALQHELRQRGRSKAELSQVYLVLADRAFEAWLLADAEGLHRKRAFCTAPRFGCFEGQLGAQAKKGVVELSHLLGRPYEKTRDGPNLFRKLRFAHARRFQNGGRGSQSLDRFLRALGI